MEQQKKRVHLICNAHLDPVWQWEWEEGAAEAVSTFRVAVRFCEEYGDFVFCHNEGILYEWVREYEPALYEKIQRLVKAGKWHIMGGWYIQPDRNMPSGEGFVRQSLFGRRYFDSNFGVRPKTAIDFDAFGHSRGLVQILAKSGYENDIITRPDNLKVPSDMFTWVGYDGSKITTYFARESYRSILGEAVDKIRTTMDVRKDEPLFLCLWGVGNHGGGPSKVDMDAITEMREELKKENIELIHSTPENFFDELKKSGRELPEVARALNYWDPGCYTSQIRIKQKYRAMENIMFMTEKMCSAAAANGLMEYPKKEFDEATIDLLTAQFHDYLPGSSVQPVEEMGIRKLDHGIEIVNRVRARAFFALSGGQKVAASDEIPILVYNPHPYPITTDVECEFMLWEQNLSDMYFFPTIYDEAGNPLPTQPEKELSTIPMDWRKRVAFHCTLAPSSMSRFNCRFVRFHVDGYRPQVSMPASATHYLFDNGRLQVNINLSTGLVDKYVVDGVNYLKPGAFGLDVIRDDFDPWGMRVFSFRDMIGSFSLLDPKEGSLFSGIEDNVIPSVRVIEDGDVRTVIEAVFGYNRSRAVIRYKLSKTSTYMDVEVHLNWNEKQRLLKLAIPTVFETPRFFGQVPYGVELNQPTNGDEIVAQKYVGLAQDNRAVTMINDGVYGSSVEGNALKVTLIRSPGYTCHPYGDRVVMPTDRYMPYIDQGERTYSFRFDVGAEEERCTEVGREALTFNEKPMALSFYPSGAGERPLPVAVIGGKGIEMNALKRAEDGDATIVRLFNPFDYDQEVPVELPALHLGGNFRVPAFSFITLRARDGVLEECSLLEEDL